MRHGSTGWLTAAAIFMLGALAVSVGRAEDGYEAWLRYRAIADAAQREAYRASMTSVVVVGEPSEVLDAAAAELRRGLGVMLGPIQEGGDEEAWDPAAIRLATPDTADDALRAALAEAAPAELGPDAYALWSADLPHGRSIVIVGGSDRAVLHGAFDLLRRVQLGEPVDDLRLRHDPPIRLRMVNHWDNIDGTIERGYAGPSIFRWDELPELDERYTDYARLLASLGIGATCVNNVNAGKGNNIQMLSPAYLDKVAALAGAFRPWGVRVFLAAGWDAPRKLGGLSTADPHDPAVRAWWAAKADEIYARIPDFGGFVVKADSEGQPGPYAYDRDHADGANMLAEALRPHGGVVFWRAFVYELRAGDDRAAMAYHHFQPLDGRFADNVLIQIKNGPLDFQVREPVSPLLGALPQTRLALELQITQEYTGHDIHLCYLAQSWKDVLDFDTHAQGEGSTVARRLGHTAGEHPSAITGVLNVGADRTWLGHHLHMANFYAFGRLASDPRLEPRAIAREWATMTFGHDPVVIDTLVEMLLASYDLYEGYTSPLGLGVLHDVATHLHPVPEIRHRYHQADSRGVGFDRTSATGSGFVDQYAPPVAERYESLDTCPDELLLFFHHVPYTHSLHSGKTVIQHIYDSHFDGVEGVVAMRQRWAALAGRVDAGRHAHVLAKLDQQIEHARHWRDRINRFFFELSGVPDEGRRIRSGYRLRHVGE